MKVLYPIFCFLFFVYQTNLFGKEPGGYSGILIDLETHKPISSAIIHLTDIGFKTNSNENGVFSFNDIPEGEHYIEITHIGYKTLSKTVNFTKQKKIEIIHLQSIAIQLQTVIVAGIHDDIDLKSFSDIQNVLKGKDLERELNNTLAASLKNEAGIAIRSMGPAPTRPVIRGIGGDRVIINEDGVKSVDLSATSPDHAVSIEPFTIENIEIQRGPKLLLYSNSTMGGLLNIVRNVIPDHINENIEGSFGFYGETVNNGYLGSGMLEIPFGKFQAKGEITYRKTGELKTPVSLLKNSELSTIDFVSGLSYVFNDGFLGASVREYNSEYGIPGGFIGAHPNGARIEMFKREIQVKSKIKLNIHGFDEVEINLSRNYYNHKEFEGSTNIIGAEFGIENYWGNIIVDNNQLLFFTKGKLGISYENKNSEIGGFVFTAPTIYNQFALFSVQQFSNDDMSIELGGRFQYSQYSPRRATKSTREEFLINRHFNSFSLSLSIQYKLFSKIFIGFNVSRSSRVPSIEELYTEGPHLAAYSYEKGNPELKEENGVNSEIFLYADYDWIKSTLNYFRYDINSYIQNVNTGKINYATLLPIYQAINNSALITGIEYEMELSFIENIRLHNTLSFSFGENRTINEPLSMMPPLKNITKLIYSIDNFSLGFISEIAARQNRLGPFEETTDGYLILGTFAQYSFQMRRVIHSLSLNVDNIFDNEYRNHLSRVKVLMPEAGRNIRLIYKLFF